MRRLALCLPALLAACGDSAPTGPPHILLVSIDSLRGDHLSANGYRSATNPDRATSPRMDALAAEGVRFERFLSSTSWTLPAHMTLLTGLPDPVHGVTDITQRLDPMRTTLAEAFGAAGYETAGFFSGPNLHPYYGFAQGFDIYENCASYKVELEAFGDSGNIAMMDVHEKSHRDISGPRVVETWGQWLENRASQDRPSFSFVHLWDAHYDFVPPKEFDVFDPAYRGAIDGTHFLESEKGGALSPRDLRHWLALYDGEILSVDAQIGAMLDKLESLGLADNTLVVVTSDHGDEFKEHGAKGHQSTLYDEVVRVPLILRWPDRLPAGAVVRGTAGLVGLAPTLCDLAGLPPLTESRAESLRPMWEGQDTDRPVLMTLDLPTRGLHVSAAQQGDAKIFWDENTERGVSFDLGSDPKEVSPRGVGSLAEAGSPGRLLVQLRDQARRHRDALASTEGYQGQALPSEVMAELERLGYVDPDSAEED